MGTALSSRRSNIARKHVGIERGLYGTRSNRLAVIERPRNVQLDQIVKPKKAKQPPPLPTKCKLPLVNAGLSCETRWAYYSWADAEWSALRKLYFKRVVLYVYRCTACDLICGTCEDDDVDHRDPAAGSPSRVPMQAMRSDRRWSTTTRRRLPASPPPR